MISKINEQKQLYVYFNIPLPLNTEIEIANRRGVEECQQYLNL